MFSWSDLKVPIVTVGSSSNDHDDGDGSENDEEKAIGLD